MTAELMSDSYCRPVVKVGFKRCQNSYYLMPSETQQANILMTFFDLVTVICVYVLRNYTLAPLPLSHGALYFSIFTYPNCNSPLEKNAGGGVPLWCVLPYFDHWHRLRPSDAFAHIVLWTRTEPGDWSITVVGP